MLTRMESFPGVFIASTNLTDGLDQTALRRFDMKISFGYLAPEQTELMLVPQCAAFGSGVRKPAGLRRVRASAMLTLGDFAALGRRHRFSPFSPCAAVMERLTQECAPSSPSCGSVPAI
jgi:transitional endoplasmic reticulum ATPase